MLLQQRLCLARASPRGCFPSFRSSRSLGGRYRWSPAPLMEKLSAVIEAPPYLPWPTSLSATSLLLGARWEDTAQAGGTDILARALSGRAPVITSPGR